MLGAIAAVVYYVNMYVEERGNMEKFGEAYVQYMKRVPRLNFIARILRTM